MRRCQDRCGVASLAAMTPLGWCKEAKAACHSYATVPARSRRRSVPPHSTMSAAGGGAVSQKRALSSSGGAGEGLERATPAAHSASSSPGTCSRQGHSFDSKLAQKPWYACSAKLSLGAVGDNTPDGLLRSATCIQEQPCPAHQLDARHHCGQVQRAGKVRPHRSRHLAAGALLACRQAMPQESLPHLILHAALSNWRLRRQWRLQRCVLQWWQLGSAGHSIIKLVSQLLEAAGAAGLGQPVQRRAGQHMELGAAGKTKACQADHL